MLCATVPGSSLGPPDWLLGQEDPQGGDQVWGNSKLWIFSCQLDLLWTVPCQGVEIIQKGDYLIIPFRISLHKFSRVALFLMEINPLLITSNSFKFTLENCYVSAQRVIPYKITEKTWQFLFFIFDQKSLKFYFSYFRNKKHFFTKLLLFLTTFIFF